MSDQCASIRTAKECEENSECAVDSFKYECVPIQGIPRGPRDPLPGGNYNLLHIVCKIILRSMGPLPTLDDLKRKLQPLSGGGVRTRGGSETRREPRNAPRKRRTSRTRQQLPSPADSRVVMRNTFADNYSYERSAWQFFH